MTRRGRFGKYGELKRKARLRASRISRAKGSRSKPFFRGEPRKSRRRRGPKGRAKAGSQKAARIGNHVQ